MAARADGRIIKDLDGTPIAAAIQQTLEVQQSHEGPVPDPRTLQGYEETLPGAADRILTMAEENAKFLREHEAKKLECFHQDKQQGRKDSKLVVLSAFSLAALALVLGYDKTGEMIATFTVVSLASIFVLNKLASLPLFSKKDNND